MVCSAPLGLWCSAARRAKLLSRKERVFSRRPSTSTSPPPTDSWPLRQQTEVREAGVRGRRARFPDECVGCTTILSTWDRQSQPLSCRPACGHGMPARPARLVGLRCGVLSTQLEGAAAEARALDETQRGADDWALLEARGAWTERAQVGGVQVVLHAVHKFGACSGIKSHLDLLTGPMGIRLRVL